MAKELTWHDAFQGDMPVVAMGDGESLGDFSVSWFGDWRRIIGAGIFRDSKSACPPAVSSASFNGRGDFKGFAGLSEAEVKETLEIACGRTVRIAGVKSNLDRLVLCE